jgi:hypothetical protein
MIPVVELDDEIVGFGKLSERNLSTLLREKIGRHGLLRRLGLRR